jgi:stage V sporulation protein AE
MNEIIAAFVVGGILCLIGQLIIDITPYNITPAHVLVGYVIGGAVLSAFGLYQPLINIGGAGASIPLSGFGHTLAQGALDAVKSQGLLGAFGGGISATSIGIAAAIIFGYMMAVIFNPQE